MDKGNTRGHALAFELARAMQGANITAKELAEKLNISKSYLSELLRNERSFSNVDITLVRSIAEFVNLPVVVCLVLAGKLQHADFIEPTVTYAEELNTGMSAVMASKYGIECAVVPAMLALLPEQIKLLLVMLFQDATGISIVTPKKRWPWVEQKASPFSGLLKS